MVASPTPQQPRRRPLGLPADATEVIDSRLQIAEFTLYRHENGFTAVHIDDPKVTVEGGDWGQVNSLCAARRISRSLKHAFGITDG